MSPLTPGVRLQLKALSDAVESQPRNPVANLELAKALLAYEMYVTAEGYLRRVEVLDPRNGQAVYLLGWAHSVVGDLEAALADFDLALRLQPGHPQTLLRRADVLRRLGKTREAQQGFQRILETFPDQPQAQFGLGSVLLALGQSREAITTLKGLVAGYDQYGAAHYALALAYRNAGDEENARRHFAAYEANRTWEPEFEDEPIEQIKNLNRSHQGLYQRSLKAAAADDWSQAAALLEEATSEDPHFLVGHVNLITCYAHLGNADKAEEHYRQALALSPASAELQNTQGLVAKLRGRPAEARAHFRRAIQSDPNHYTSYENLGLLSFEEGDLPSALRNYHMAASIAPSSSRSWVMIGTIHLKQGDSDQALDAFLRVVRPGPEAEPALYSVRKAYESANDRPGWLSFARAAQNRARLSGMTGVQARLERTIP